MGLGEGWKSTETAIPEGNRIFYNFLRPHMALEGQTPAQAAGINLELEGNKWLELNLRWWRYTQGKKRKGLGLEQQP